MSSTAIQELETRINGLRELIARRKSQSGNVQHEGTFSDTSKHVAAAEKELRDLAGDYVRLKCDGHGWDAVEVIERMKAAPPAPRVIEREVKSDETRIRLEALIAESQAFVPRSKLQELIR